MKSFLTKLRCRLFGHKWEYVQVISTESDEWISGKYCWRCDLTVKLNGGGVQCH